MHPCYAAAAVVVPPVNYIAVARRAEAVPADLLFADPLSEVALERQELAEADHSRPALYLCYLEVAAASQVAVASFLLANPVADLASPVLVVYVVAPGGSPFVVAPVSVSFFLPESLMSENRLATPSAVAARATATSAKL